MRGIRQTYPECPQCETDLLVEGYTGYAAYICHGCDATWGTDRADDGRAP